MISSTETIVSNFAETEELTSCPNCGSRKLAKRCRAHDRLHELSRQEFAYSLCRDCRLLFLSVRPLEKEAHKFYPKEYGPHQSARELEVVQASSLTAGWRLPASSLKFISQARAFLISIINSKFPDTFHEALRRIYSPPAEGARLLDFGCGSDRFLNWAREQGWRTAGIDFAARSVEQVRSSGHQAFLMSPDVWAEIEDESLDCVRVNHVLEHLYHPKGILMALRQKMKTGARMHVAVPNPCGLSALIFRSWWRGLDCPRHVALYPIATLKHLFLELGFAEVDVRHETATRDLIGSIGYLMHDAKLIGPHRLDRMLDSKRLNSLFFMPARMAARVGRGDRIHVLVRKA